MTGAARDRVAPPGETTAALNPTDGVELARLAVGALAAHLSKRSFTPPEPASPVLGRPGASFVTLERAGALRGCVGTIEVTRPLWHDVVRNAVRAAADPRLPAVTIDEWPGLDIKLSVLSLPEPVPAPAAGALAALLRPGIDGLLLTDGARRATFLPAVWRKLAEPDRFVAALLVKGGWPAGSWPAGLVAHRYTAVEFHDRAPRQALTA
jgi:AmmeMemoRadiSam system protein A